MKRYLVPYVLLFSSLIYGQTSPSSAAKVEAIPDTLSEIVDISSSSSDQYFTNDQSYLNYSSDSLYTDSLDLGSMFALDSTYVEDDPQSEAGGDLEAFLTGKDTGLLVGQELIGYTAGLDFGLPIFRYGGLGASFDNKGLAEGFTINSPFGLHIGSMEIGFGVQFGNYSFVHKVTGESLGGGYLLATANTSIWETVNGTVSTQVGAGIFGKSIGITVGAAFDYAVPNYPLVIRPYLRANSTLDSGVDPGNSTDTPSYTWFNLGIMTSYDLSILTHQIANSETYIKLRTKIMGD
ncbi:MAG: hypothetical protein K9N35_01575 [Candidatus Marinimicrobia bacterium]|nr:hypothetical protein [Candidatus Neomarinimicrobiota bacterium]